MKRLLTQLACILAAAGTALAEQRFPLPEFTTGYELPSTADPAARAESFGYLDVAALVIALGVAAYLVLKRRSRRGVFVLMLLSLAYFGFYRQGCICAVGAIQNVAQALGDATYALPLVAGAFFLLPLLAALFFGRAFCAAVCPLGAAQDVVLIRPVKVPFWLQHALGIIPFLYLGAAVLFAALGAGYLICRYDPFVAFFRLSGSTVMLAAGVAVLALSTVVGRPYCRFLCPYGALLRLVAPFARWRVRISPRECIKCRLCEDSCPFGAIHPPTPEKQPGGRFEGKRRLALLLVLLPVLLALGGWLGWMSGPALARMHPTVHFADSVWLDQEGKLDAHRLERDDLPIFGKLTPEQRRAMEAESFRRLGMAEEDIYRQALAIRRRFTIGGLLLGVWTGLVIGLTLIGLSIRRGRTEYEADPGECLACGRCYQYCPVKRGEPAPESPAKVS